MMEDISDEELKRIEKSSSQPSQTEREISDEQLIKMTQEVSESKKPIQTAVKNNIVEPDMSQPMINPMSYAGNTNTNYWKIEGLPSKGKFYPQGTEIQGRPMKVLEVKKVSSINEDNGDFVLNDIVRKTIKGIDHNEMYVADKLYAIFWLRANTYRDSGYVVPFICSKCEKKSEYHFEVDNLEVQQISDDFSPNKDIKLKNGDTIRYDYLKIKDELYIDRFKELNGDAVGEIDDELLGMSQMIKSINGKAETLLQKYHWLINLDPGDYSYLRTYFEKKGMGIKPFVNITCNSCGGTAVTAVNFRADFFIPETKFE